MPALGRARGRLARGARRRGLPRGARPAAARLRRPARRRSTAPGRLSEAVGHDVWLKREDLLHTGAHKINNALGQALLAQRMGKRAHHRRDRGGPARRRHRDGLRAAGPGVHRLHGHRGHAPPGAQRPADGAARRRRSPPSRRARARSRRPCREAIRDWVANVEDTHYIIGSRGRPGAVPGARARPAARHRRRGARPGPRGRGRLPRPRDRLRRRRLERDRHVHRLRRRRRASSSSASRRRARASPPAATARR